MHWNVYIHDVNNKTIKSYDIFSHTAFAKSVKELKKLKLSKEEFAEKLRRELQYYFWAKCEFEIVITSFPPYISTSELNNLNDECQKYEMKYGREPRVLDVDLTVGQKIDIYSQVYNTNWGIFVDYVYNYKEKR